MAQAELDYLCSLIARLSDDRGRSLKFSLYIYIPESPIPVVRVSVDKIDLSSWHATNWPVKSVSDTNIHIPSVETLKVGIEWDETLK